MYFLRPSSSCWQRDSDAPLSTDESRHFSYSFFRSSSEETPPIDTETVCESDSNSELAVDAEPSTKGLCSVCEAIDIPALLTPSGTGQFEKVILGVPDDVKNRQATCDFCGLIWKHYSSSQIAQEHNHEKPTLYIQGYNFTNDIPPHSSNTSGQGQRLKICCDKKLASLSQCCFLELQSLLEPELSTSSFNLEHSQAGRLERRRTSFSGRLFDPGQVDFNLPKFWLSQCISEHGYQCDHSHIFKHLKAAKNLFVVDVRQNCVVRQFGFLYCTEYAALSYVWGDKENVTHTRANSYRLQQVNGLDSFPIPATIKDAILVTKKLGIRYLWVDSLCVIQDSCHKYSQIHQMASIYAYATVTIVDGSGKSCDDGLPGVRKYTRASKQEKISFQGTSFVTLVENSSPVARFKRLKESAWCSRGWTLQEFLFSSRLLIFTEDQVYWHCDSADWLEETVLESPSSSPPRDLDHHHGYFGTTFNGFWLRSLFRMKSNSVGTMESRWYANLVQEYKHRFLTYETDVLHAITGLLVAKEKICQYSFYWGVPERLFCESLSWIDEGAKRTDVEGRMSYAELHCPRERIPSWLWAAWKGRPGAFDWLCRQGQRIQSEVEIFRWDASGTWKRVDERKLPLADQQRMRETEWKNEEAYEIPMLEQQRQHSTGTLMFWTSRAKVVIRRTRDLRTQEMQYEVLPPFKHSRNFKGLVKIYLGNTDHIQLMKMTVPIYEDLHEDDEIFKAYLVVYGRLFVSPTQQLDDQRQGFDWRPTSSLVCMVVEHRNGVAYRLGIAVVSEADWIEVMDNKWSLVTLG